MVVQVALVVAAAAEVVLNLDSTMVALVVLIRAAAAEAVRLAALVVQV